MLTKAAFKSALQWAMAWLLIYCLAPLPVQGSVQSPIMGPFIEIWTDVFENNHPSVAYNSRRNEFMVVWSTVESATKWSLWGRRVFMDGTMSGLIEIRRLENDLGSEPVIVYNPEKDEYLVAFKMVSLGWWGTLTNIGAHILNGEGIRTKDIIVSDIWSLIVKEQPAVAFNNAANEYLVVWMERESPNTSNVQGRRIDADGNLLNLKKLAGTVDQHRSNPAVAHNPVNNDYFIAYGWEGAAPPKILGVSCSADLATVGLERAVSGGTVDMDPAITFGGGEFAAVWWKIESSILARRINAAGDPLGPASGFTVMPNEYPIYPRKGDVAYIGQGLFLVVAEKWNFETADEGDIAGRLLKTGMDDPYGNIFMIDGSPNYQGAPKAACTSRGTCLVVYVHNPVDYPGGTLEIRGRLLHFYESIYLPLILGH